MAFSTWACCVRRAAREQCRLQWSLFWEKEGSSWSRVEAKKISLICSLNIKELLHSSHHCWRHTYTCARTLFHLVVLVDWTLKCSSFLPHCRCVGQSRRVMASFVNDSAEKSWTKDFELPSPLFFSFFFAECKDGNVLACEASSSKVGWTSKKSQRRRSHRVVG